MAPLRFDENMKMLSRNCKVVDESLAVDVVEDVCADYEVLEPSPHQDVQILVKTSHIKLPVTSGTWIEFRAPGDEAKYGRVIDVEINTKKNEDDDGRAGSFSSKNTFTKKVKVNIFEKVNRDLAGWNRRPTDYRLNEEIYQTKKIQVVDAACISNIVFVHKVSSLQETCSDVVGMKNVLLLRFRWNYIHERYEDVESQHCLSLPSMYEGSSSCCPFTDIWKDQETVKSLLLTMFNRKAKENVSNTFGETRKIERISNLYWNYLKSFFVKNDNTTVTTTTKTYKKYTMRCGMKVLASKQKQTVEGFRLFRDKQFDLLRQLTGKLTCIGLKDQKPTYDPGFVEPRRNETFIYMLKETNKEAKETTIDQVFPKRWCCIEFVFNAGTRKLYIRTRQLRRKLDDSLLAEEWAEDLLTINNPLLLNADKKKEFNITTRNWLHGYHGGSYKVTSVTNGIVSAVCRSHEDKKEIGKVTTMTEDEARTVMRAYLNKNKNLTN